MNNILFITKKVISALLMPTPVIILLLLSSVLLLQFNKARKAAIVLLIFTTSALFLLSYDPVVNPLVSALESSAPVYQYNAQQPLSHIAVLGSFHQSEPGYPVTSEIHQSGIVRLTEGLRIYRLNAGSKLIFTGFRGLSKDPVSYPQKLKELAIALGVEAQDIIVLHGARDTSEEADMIAAEFPHSNLALVTTAMHMPRALGLFRGAGLNPVAAPTEHMGRRVKGLWSRPNAFTLYKMEYWVHEKLGYFWGQLRGQIEQ